ncbi:ABC transporter substrate-binding protein [Oceanibacterium hippocampi]|uniref:Putative thiamine biosynthesis protein n=1 Tax=Oceanibacterium hippocampi TaxID=745714 RepID=A0A1Y5RYG7_9PROT|nr:ABC transporter substrate-binding protein [Oceanibacterium hippocampi]SLN27870.1 Putative thiamine biosynthesis protein [Oceanibacterium hippocampi]
MLKVVKWLAAACAAGGMMAAPAQAGTEINFILNWIAGGDHAPYYWAQKNGLYEKAGIDLNIEQGKGSSKSSQFVGVGKNEIGLADLGTALVAKGKDADLVAVYNVYANSPYGMYWLKSSGIKDVKDLAGRKIGTPAWDAARTMWPALAKSVGMDPDSVTWVNVQPNAKLSALKSGSIDATTSFYNIHHIFQRELGEDMGFFPWKEYGINPYGNSIIVNGKFLKEHKDAVAAFVKVTQNAFHECAVNPDPCVEALVEANTGLTAENEKQNWLLVAELMSDETSRNVALGYFKPERMDADYELVEAYFNLEKPFDINDVYTNEFIDMSVKMPQ